MTKKIKRDTKGQFAAGASGNPKGRPPSLLNTQLRKELEADSRQILQQVVEAAKAGDMQAAKIILDRVLPPLKAVAPPVQIDGLGTSTSALEQAQLVLGATGQGSLAPDLAARARIAPPSLRVA